MSHAEFERLVATAIDFPLSRDEAAALATHRQSCATCLSAERLLRGDAELLRGLPRINAPAEVRDALAWSGTSPMRPATGGRARWLVMLVAALLLMTMATGTIVVGGWLRDEREESLVDPSASGSPAESALVDESAEPRATLGPTATPSATQSSSPSPTASASPSPSPSSTPLPTASPPVVASGSWATVIVDQTAVRDAPMGTVLGRLPIGEAVFVGDGSESASGLTWYPVVTRSWGAAWVASGGGTVDTLGPLDSAYLEWSGRVMGPTVELDPYTDMRLTPYVNIGGLPLDAALFDPGMVAAFSVAWGSGISLAVDLDISGGQTVGAVTSMAVGMCEGRADLGALGQLSLRFGEVEIVPDGSRTDVTIILHDTLLGFPHAQATASLPNLGQALLLSYYGNDGTTCIQVDARGAKGSTQIARRVITTDCLTVLSRTDDEVLLVDDEDSDAGFAHRFSVGPDDVVDPAVQAGATLGLRVLADRGWSGPDLSITLEPAAC